MIGFLFLGLAWKVDAGLRMMRWNLSSGRQHSVLFGLGRYDYPDTPAAGRTWYLVLPGFRVQVGKA